MRLIFRADASQSVGTGHVMRCSAVIEEAISHNIECILVGNLGGIAWLEERIQILGVPHYKNTKQLKISSSKDVLILDSYEIPKHDSFIQPDLWKFVVVVSDESTPDYNATLVINLTLNQIKHNQFGPRYLSGRDFIPFRKTIKKTTKKNFKKLNKIVVFAGGIDTFNFALTMATGMIKFENFNKVIFISSMSSEITSLDSRYKVRDFGSVLDMELEDADLVFTTASTSSMEIIAREIPLGLCYTVNNQIPYFNSMLQKKLAFNIGHLGDDGRWEIDWEQIKSVINDPSLRENLVANTKGFFDLKGSKRIVDEILKL